MIFMSIKFLKQLPTQLILCIMAGLVLGGIIDLYYVKIFYSISGCFIEILLFILPLVIFSFIFRALTNIKQNALVLLIIIFMGVTISNFVALTASYLYGKAILPIIFWSNSEIFSKINFSASTEVLFKLNLPNIIGTWEILIISIISSVIISTFYERNNIIKHAYKYLLSLSDIINFALIRIFIPLIPIYIFGFCIKLSHENTLTLLFTQYGIIFFVNMSLIIVYLFILYFIGSKCSFYNLYYNIKKMLPAGLTAFSTMSSAATIPVTLKCVENITKDKDFTGIVVPSTANIHMLGDDLTIIMISMTLLSQFNMPWPNFIDFVPFAISFSIAKFSSVGLPGVSIFVIFPVLQAYLGLTPEMISILMTVHLLEDPFVTTTNVMGNGAFALIIQRFLLYKSKTNP